MNDKSYYKSGYVTVESCGDGPYIALRIRPSNMTSTDKTVCLANNKAYLRLYIDQLVHDLLDICEEMEGEE